MKRIASILVAMATFLLVAATPAFAGYAPKPPVPGGTHGGAGTAFTGSNLSVGVVLLVVLVVGGLMALLISRRATARN